MRSPRTENVSDPPDTRSDPELLAAIVSDRSEQAFIEIFQRYKKRSMDGRVINVSSRAHFHGRILKLLMSSPETGARTVIHLAESNEVRGITGKYFENCIQTAPAATTSDMQLRNKLWKMSEELTGINAWRH